ncbi:response regulator [archaeon]|nr:MAG: response regulator [archaeon]
MKMTTCGIVSVEDNKMDGLVIKRTLSDLTCEDVTVIRDGHTALDFFCDDSKIPCLILLDINLPFKSGLEILKEIREREHLRKVPIVMFSSSQIDEEVENAYELGANSYVAKPSDHEQLEKALERIYEFWFETAMTAHK